MSSMTLSDSKGHRLEPTVNVHEGSPYTFMCTVIGVRPVATIEWFLSNVLQRAVDYQIVGNDGLLNITSIWTLPDAARENHRQEVKCVTNNSVSEQPFPEIKVTLNIQGMYISRF